MSEEISKKHFSDMMGSVISEDEAYSWLERLQLLYEKIYTTDGSVKDKLAAFLTTDEHSRIVDLIEKTNTSMSSSEQVGKLLMAIKNYLNDLPELQLTLAFAPRQSWSEEILEWLTEDGPGAARVNIEVDPKIMGGIVVGWNGLVHDLSLRSKLDKLRDLQQGKRKLSKDSINNE